MQCAISKAVLKRRGIVFLLILFLPLFSLSASWSFGLSLGYRDSTMADMPLLTEIMGSYKDLDMRFSFQGGDELDLYLRYDLRVGKTMHNLFKTHSQYIPIDRGGYSDFSYEFSQFFRWKYGGLGYCIGLQVALAYSHFSRDVTWSISPLVAIDGELYFGPVDLGGYVSFNSDNERSWKSVPVIGVMVRGHINTHNTVIAEGWIKGQEYFMDPWLLIDAWGVKLSYSYIGG